MLVYIPKVSSHLQVFPCPQTCLFYTSLCTKSFISYAGVSLPRDMLFYGGIYTLGDISQQFWRLKNGESVDLMHAARIGLVTLTFFGPGFHKLYRSMDRWYLFIS